MRRSAAPSQQSCKRACFRVPYANKSTNHLNQTKQKTVSHVLEHDPPEQPVRTTLDILKLIRESDNLQTDEESSWQQDSSPQNLVDMSYGDLDVPSLSPSFNHTVNPTVRHPDSYTVNPSDSYALNSPVNPTVKRPNSYITTDNSTTKHNVNHNVLQPSNHLPNQPATERKIYSVLYCKLSTKKHKTWEGDGLLSVNGRTLVLKDLDGKEITRSSGYKSAQLSQLEEGSTIKVGSKECEIQCLLPDSTGEAMKVDNNLAAPQEPQVIQPKAPKIVPKLSVNHGIKPRHKPLHSPDDPGALVMPRPDLKHQETYNRDELPVVDVVVDPLLSSKLRPHQVDGVSFLYKCVMDMGDHPGQGAILADEMGLGKTLQVISLIWTLLKQGPYGGLPVLKKVLIITPGSLVKNWVQEFYKWLGKFRIYLYAVDQSHKVEDFLRSCRTYPILILSYEMFVRSCESLETVNFDLVVCDEGHRLKNSNIKTTSSIMALSTGRKVLLTGTPIQNDLQEFYSLLSLCNPGCLGSASEFRRWYEDPIVAAQQPNCSEADIELGAERAQELAELTSTFVLRRTQDTLKHFLPAKVENVVFCRLSSLQRKLYAQAVEESWEANPLSHILNLRKLCNHPQLLANQNLPLCQTSGKLQVLSAMLGCLQRYSPRERVVLVSHSTQMLDLVEQWCQSQNYSTVRLDGSTPTASRQALVDGFNSPQSPHWIFLLSAKAGGLGLSLVGASRLILLDPDWNPVSDLQALARIWREGQLRVTHLYRLLAAGSIEEKIYQRQISKQGLCGALADCQDMAKFHLEDLKDLFTFEPDSACSTHELLECDCTAGGSLEEVEPRSGNLSMAELLQWEHHCGPVDQDLDPLLASAGDNITFLFRNTSMSPQI